MRLKRALVSLGGDVAGAQRLCSRAPTVERLLTSDLELLARECGLDHTELKRLATTVAAASVQPVRTARQVLAARRTEAPLLSTGVPPLDALLKGGLRAGEVCELVGAPGSGKTAVCVAACAAQAETSHSVLVLDATNGFRARRLHEALRQRRVPRLGGGVTSLPKATRTAFLEARLRVATTPQLLCLIRQLEDLAANLGAISPDAFHASLRLVVIDGVFSAVVAEGAALSKSAAGAQLARLQLLLRTLASQHRLAVLMTNLAVPCTASNDDEAPAAAGAPRATKPALGVAWQHKTDVRLQLGEAPASGQGYGRAQPTSASPPPVHLPRTLSVLKSSLAARGVMEGETAAAVLSAAGLFV